MICNDKLTKRLLGSVGLPGLLLGLGLLHGCISNDENNSSSAPPQIYVTDQHNDRVVRIDNLSGAGWTSIGTYGDGPNQFAIPYAIFVDTAGKIYVADSANNRIVRMDDMTGVNWIAFGTYGTGTNQFAHLSGIYVDTAGKIYVADTNNRRIVRMDDMTGTNWTTLGTSGSGTKQFG